MEWQISTLSWNEIPRIDLHRDRREQRSNVYLRSRRYVIVAALCLLSVAGILIPASVKYVDMRSSTADIRRETSSLTLQAADIAQQAASLQGQAQAYREYRADTACRQAWPALLSALAAAAPRGVYLNSVSVDSSSQEVSIAGSAATVALIDQFVRQMQSSPAFSSTTLTETDLDLEDADGFRFRVTADAGVSLSNGQ
jgi:Tfp pilus assembly protein PilN